MLQHKRKEQKHYVAGGQSLSDVSGDKTSRSKGLFDYWIVDVVFKTATQTIAATTESNAAAKIPLTSFIIYPNPAKDVLHIQTSGKSNVDLTDAYGTTVFTKTISGNSDINISGLLPGIYFLKNEATSEVKKVLVAR